MNQMKKNRGPELALRIAGELEKYKAPLSQEQTEGIIQQEFIKGGYNNDDLQEAVEIIAVFIATGALDAEEGKPIPPTMN